MTYRNLRTALLGSAVGAGLLVAGGPAHALSTQIGDVSIVFDTTVSLGGQISVQDPNRKLISEANGGNQAPPAAVAIPGTASAFGVPGNISLNTEPDQSFGASINGDDGRLNFGRGDFTSATIKATHDLQASWRNFTLFARANEFFDFVQADPDNFKRNGIADEKQEEAVRDVRLLDLYISGDFEVGSLPVNLRAGKQVISWGEGTFIQNGVNVINPIDVTAFRRPGVEIKEGLIPIWAIYGSVGLPFDLSLEAFYQLDWEPFQLDVGGTHFATSDVGNPNSSFGGNQGIGFFSGGAFPNSVRQNCAGSGFQGLAAATAAGLTPLSAVPGGIAAAGQVANAFPACQVGSLIDFNTRLTPGQAESQLIALNPLLGTRRGDDGTADDSGQFGLALRWYAEALNSTEFGFYFVNYHSRLPYAQIAPTAGALPQVILGTESASGTIASKAPRFLGCATFLGTGAFGDATMPQNVNLKVSDPNAVITNLAGFADTLLAAAANPAAGQISASIAANGANAFDAARINCAMQLATAGAAGGGLSVVMDGEPVIGLQQDLSTTLVYPEDIELWGLSFNTTVGTWGVQGEFTYRPNMPFQTDTDQATINAAGGGQCSGLVGFGDALGGANPGGVSLNNLSTSPLPIGTDSTRNCNLQNFGSFNPAFVREEMFTAQIGTTATFTNSNPLIEMIGADLGILVTEFGLVHVPDVPDEVTNTGGLQDRFLRFANICNSGTDLPLGGVLALDNRNGCRPTETSYGYNLLGRLDYFNAFGTAWTVSPQVAWRHDLEGFTPAPVSNFREDFRSINLSVSANFQNTWTVSAGYTAFMGDPKFHNNIDQDFASLTATYSF